LPIITIPTTAATGSEANTNAVITNWETHEKCPLINKKLIPKVAICDPELQTSIPPKTTADGCVDIISHGFESYFNGDDDCTVQDRITEGLYNVVFEWGPVAYRNGTNVRARQELMYASTLILSGLANSGRGGAWPMHTIEHAISGHYDIPHGRGLAIVIPRYLRFIIDTIPHRLAQFGRNCFNLAETDEKSMAAAAVVQLVEWFDKIGENITLRDVGIGDEKFEAMTDDILRNFGTDGVFDNIVPLDRDSLMTIFAMCLEPN
jgi:alcohol dehydrogenase YqhD (iron-dependent ADH family)